MKPKTAVIPRRILLAYLLIVLFSAASPASAGTIHDPDFIQNNLPVLEGPGMRIFGRGAGVGGDAPEGDGKDAPEEVIKEDAAEPGEAGPGEIRPEWRSGEPVKPEADIKQPDAAVSQAEKDQEHQAAETEEIGEEDIIPDIESMFTGPGQPTGVDPVKIIAILDKDLFGGRLLSPSVVHYDPEADEIYVIGATSHPSSTVTVFGADFFPAASLGLGRDIRSPNGLALDKAGNIYFAQSICRNDKPCLKVINQAFFPVAEIYFSGINGVPDTFRPQAVAVSQDYVYLTGAFANGVLVLDRDYKFRRWLVPMKVKGGMEMVGDDISQPRSLFVNDVVVDENGRIYIISLDAGRIFVLDRDWNFLFAFGEKGGSSGKLSQARSLAVDVDRQVIYVVDYMRHGVNLYDYTDGHYLFEIGGLGFAPGWFRYPTHVAVDGRGNLLVADYFNHRVQVIFVP